MSFVTLFIFITFPKPSELQTATVLSFLLNRSRPTSYKSTDNNSVINVTGMDYFPSSDRFLDDYGGLTANVTKKLATASSSYSVSCDGAITATDLTDQAQKL
jgi:hypothetical protein